MRQANDRDQLATVVEWKLLWIWLMACATP